MRALGAIALAVVATLVLAASAGERTGGPPERADAAPAPPLDPGTAPLAGSGGPPSPLAVELDGGRDLVHVRFRRQPRAGLLFDLDTGRVLWRHRPSRVLPIASLTKMMTALVVVDRLPRGTRVPITRQALRYRGSGVGLLPRGKSVSVGALLYGLLLPSGNDAAIALAQRAAGSVGRFVAMMNARGRAMGLVCTRFSTPSGIRDRDNHSCAADLATLARAVLRERRLAAFVHRRSAVLPFPIKGGKLYLYNNNPLFRLGYRGTTGVKTGYTDAAGHCLVATARRGDVTLGVVLLHSPDTGSQATRLLDRGFRAEGV
jgi:D-alanyl-D-alanine carboxypeptidase